MQANQNDKKIHFGWWIVFSSFMLMFLYYATGVGMFGLLVPSLMREFKVSATVVLSIMSVGMAGNVIGSMFAGKMMMKHGLRKVWLICMLICIGGFVVNYTAQSLQVIYVSQFVRGVFGSATSMIPISILINQWFGKRMRGKAMGIAVMGSGIGTMVLSPITAYIIKNFGWRNGYLFFGALAFACIPIAYPTFIISPRMKGLARVGDVPGEVEKEVALSGMTAGEALKSGVYWAAFISILMLAGTSQNWNSNGNAYLTMTLKFDPVAAASIMSITSIGVIIGRPFFGAISDKWGNKVCMVTGGVILATGYVILAVAANIRWTIFIGAAVTGLGMSLLNVLTPLITADLFGNRDFAAIVGYMQISQAIGVMVIPLGVSAVFDSTGSYVMAWIGLAVVSLVCVAIGLLSYSLRQRRQ